MEGTFEHPLCRRYSSRAMLVHFSEEKRIRTWRLLWTLLAEAQRAVGLTELISLEAVTSLHAALASPIDFQAFEREERRTLHDVMAHLSIWAAACPCAASILHLGATSCDITDNADILLVREAMDLLIAKLVSVLRPLIEFADRTKAVATLGYTHFQSAQLTTVGKRACLWIQDLLGDLRSLQSARDQMLFRGLKGTTGTQASFLALLGGDVSRVRELERHFCELAGFQAAYPITGQTTPRKADMDALQPLVALSVSASKMCTDVRLLAHSKQLEEPFASSQVGSSAMAYKRNPMKSERVVALSRHLICIANNATHTAANQWLERSLDDSANRRIVLPEAFLCADAILICLASIVDGLVWYPNVLDSHISHELPFLATENILMAVVAAGGSRQTAHEIIRVYSQQAAERLKQGLSNDLIDKLKQDAYFECVRDQMDHLVDPATFVGCAPSQVSYFLAETVAPVMDLYKDWPSVEMKSEI